MDKPTDKEKRIMIFAGNNKLAGAIAVSPILLVFEYWAITALVIMTLALLLVRFDSSLNDHFVRYPGFKKWCYGTFISISAASINYQLGAWVPNEFIPIALPFLIASVSIVILLSKGYESYSDN